MNVCLLIPHYDHARAIGPLLARLQKHGLPCIVVDDGSDDAAREVLHEQARLHPWLRLVLRDVNGGQGAAKRTGYRAARQAGFSHSIELDADGQHDTDDIPRFLELIRRHPHAFVMGVPVFGDDVPRSRLWGRQLSRGLVWAACASRAIVDPLCGYRALPLATALAVIERWHTGDRMSFDPEFAVRMYWSGAPILTVPTRVSYPTDGVSHFDMVRDNLRLAGTYARLLAELPLAAPGIIAARRRARRLMQQDRGELAAGVSQER
ncbi:MAG TPA: glycosyltransferase family 2 protein [Candidatus Limnocylindrales bacterium]|nr:glycosyltransferase family 2 protein [Candidatus Limnocylindrales bacterium]